MAFPPPHSFMFNTHDDHDQLPSTSLNTFPSFPPQHFQQGAPYLLKRSMSFSGIENKFHDHHEVHGDDELSDDGLQSGEKKKIRLNLDQVKALEKSFELGNKLDPERKVQLAKALGLQPRQIAIWFQNRRARCKTKQLENEFEVLKKKFEAVKDENGALKVHNQKLQGELQALKSKDWCEGRTKCLMKETEGSWSNGCDSSLNINLDLSRTQALNSSVSSKNGRNLISLLPTSLNPNNIPQLLQFTSRPELQDENFSNMFHNIDEHHNLWPWT